MPCSYIPPTDLGGMKASLEIRSPFLNKDIYEYLALNFNQKDILYSGGKQVLKDILSTYIPTNLISNKKQGFVFNLEDFIYKNTKDIDIIVNLEDICCGIVKSINIEGPRKILIIYLSRYS